MNSLGWVKLHRAVSEHPISSDPHALSVWIHLLLLANHKTSKRMLNGSMVTVNPGQIITSRKSLAAKTGVQESKIERILKALESEQQIVQQGKSKYRVISITNWLEYQSDEQQTNSKRTTDEQQMNTHKECKEGKEVKPNIRAPKSKRSLTPEDLIEMGVNESHARDWMLLRKSKRAPLTQTALEALKREAEKAGMSLAEAVRTCAERGWQGFKAEWVAGQKPAGRHTGFEDKDYTAGLIDNGDGTYGF